MNLGIQHLSDAELLAIILRIGTPAKSAVALARELLAAHENDLQRFAKSDIAELMLTKGVGEAKAVAIKASIEFGRRTMETPEIEQTKITDSQTAYRAIAKYLGPISHEECWAIYLNRANRIISRERISSGGLSATVVDIRLILKKAIDKLASGIILFHNHPSGQLYPSESDKQITDKLDQAAMVLDIQLIDHLIVTSAGYYSFKDEGQF